VEKQLSCFTVAVVKIYFEVSLRGICDFTPVFPSKFHNW